MIIKTLHGIGDFVTWKQADIAEDVAVIVGFEIKWHEGQVVIQYELAYSEAELSVFAPECELTAPSPALGVEGEARVGVEAAKIIADWHWKKFDYVYVHTGGQVTPSHNPGWPHRLKSVVASHPMESDEALAAVTAWLEKQKQKEGADALV